jgi:hypothetical protein
MKTNQLQPRERERERDMGIQADLWKVTASVNKFANALGKRLTQHACLAYTQHPNGTHFLDTQL